LRLVIACGPGAYWALTTNHGYYAGFFTGYLLAEFLLAAERSETMRRRLAGASPLGWFCLAAALALSIYVQTVAFAAQRDALSGEQSLIAALTVIGVILAAPARTWMSNRLSLFLGRISFALYLTHLLVICSFSSGLLIATVDVLPYWPGVLVIGVLTLAVAFVVAYFFAVLVEEQLLRWLKRAVLSVSNPAFDWTAAYLRILVVRLRALRPQNL
jgi:peptidoglycan/LPS O-acetylase OafA/YrhL